MISANEFKERRQKLIDKLEDKSCAVLFSGVAKMCSADEVYPFEVNHNFYYLTGVTQEDSCLILVKSSDGIKEFLLIPPFDPIKEKWYGKRITMEEASKVSGIENVLLNSALTSKLDSILGEDAAYGEIDKVYFDFEPELKVAPATSTVEFAANTIKLYKKVKQANAYPLIVSLRAKKSEAEIEEMREAINTTSLGIKAVMASAKPGVKEYELANRFFQVVNDDNKYQGLAFPTIMASGVNATCLHYPTPLDTVKNGDLILLDLGSRNNYYNADVTRTIPANGKFDEKQRLIYSIVLGCNKAVADYAKPGLTIKELNEFTINYLAGECITHGLIKSKEEISNYYYHNVSHHIGLDTHDPIDRALPLEAGNVISDEPGLYFKELGIGVRIEDDLLITETGAEVLTSGIIKEIDEIEKFYQLSK